MERPASYQGDLRVLFVWILLLGVFGSLIGAPWTLAILQDPFTVWATVLVEVLLLLPTAAALGVWLGERVGLGSRLRAVVSGRPGSWEWLRSGFPQASLVGLALGGFVFFAQSLIPQSALIPDLNKPNTFVLFLRTLSAGLTEEIAFRFGLMTFFVWALRSIVRKPSFEVPSLWVGNLLSAVLFASAHLNQFTYQGWDLLLPFMIVSSGTGMVMGWLYMRYGLVSAILAHFVADVTAHVLPRLVTGFG